MKIIKPYFVIEDDIDGEKILKDLERYGRTAYKSETKITFGSAAKFIRGIIESGHESVIEHEKITVRVICDRGVTHEIVRHRLASYTQESTRYCDYSKKGDLTYIFPFFFENDKKKWAVWWIVMEICEWGYKLLRKLGATPQEARSVLPNSLKTEIVITYNLREWRHFLKLRSSQKAHPQIREIAIPLLREFQKRIPVIFDDILPEKTVWDYNEIMPKKEGKLIVFEGGEKMGKSTQIKILAKRLRKAGIEVVVTKEPGGTEKGKEIRQKLLYGKLTPEEELKLFFEDRMIHFGEKILPAIKEGKWVLCDRSSPSTISYQHYGRGIPPNKIIAPDLAARRGKEFDLVILFDMDSQLAMKRMEAETVFEKENWDFHRRVREGYLAQAKADPEKWFILDASGPIEPISEQIWAEIKKRFGI